MIRFYKRTIKDRFIRELEEYEKGCWISLINPTNGELEFFADRFNLDIDLLKDGLDDNEIPRGDYEKNTYIYVKTINPNNHFTTFLIVIAEDFILTLSKETPLVLNQVVNKNYPVYTTQKLRFLIELLFLITEEYEAFTLNIVKGINARKQMATTLSERDVSFLLEKEEILNQLVSTYYYTGLLYQRLTKKLSFFPDDKDEIDDLIVEINQGYNMCKSSLKTISNIRSYYSITLTNKLNKILTILTIFTIALSIPAAISGIYGMNIKLPLQNNPYTFIIIMAVTIASWSTLIFYWKRNAF